LGSPAPVFTCDTFTIIMVGPESIQTQIFMLSLPDPTVIT
jgi:hypothetical protein